MNYRDHLTPPNSNVKQEPGRISSDSKFFKLQHIKHKELKIETILSIRLEMDNFFFSESRRHIYIIN